VTYKLPHCAYCGEPLAGSSRRIVETLPDLPGGPSFGWHMQNDATLGCYEKDAPQLRPLTKACPAVKKHGTPQDHERILEPLKNILRALADIGGDDQRIVFFFDN
jgi:hypothetical protein